jgi:hypothetical protein
LSLILNFGVFMILEYVGPKSGCHRWSTDCYPDRKSYIFIQPLWKKKTVKMKSVF